MTVRAATGSRRPKTNHSAGGCPSPRAIRAASPAETRTISPTPRFAPTSVTPSLQIVPPGEQHGSGRTASSSRRQPEAHHLAHTPDACRTVSDDLRSGGADRWVPSHRSPGDPRPAPSCRAGAEACAAALARTPAPTRNGSTRPRRDGTWAVDRRGRSWAVDRRGRSWAVERDGARTCSPELRFSCSVVRVEPAPERPAARRSSPVTPRRPPAPPGEPPAPREWPPGPPWER